VAASIAIVSGQCLDVPDAKEYFYIAVQSKNEINQSVGTWFKLENGCRRRRWCCKSVVLCVLAADSAQSSKVLHDCSPGSVSRPAAALNKQIHGGQPLL